MPLYIMMTNLTDEGRKTVKTNPDRIKEVFINLLGNALKFTPQKGKITLRIEDKNTMRQPH